MQASTREVRSKLRRDNILPRNYRCVRAKISESAGKEPQEAGGRKARGEYNLIAQRVLPTNAGTAQSVLAKPFHRRAVPLPFQRRQFFTPALLTASPAGEAYYIFAFSQTSISPGVLLHQRP